MLSAGQSISISWRTMLSTPPRFRPGEFSWPLKCTGNRELHLGAGGQAHEIDMHGAVGDRIELHLARDDARLLAGDVQHEQGGQEAAGFDMQRSSVWASTDTFSGVVARRHRRRRDPALLAGLVGRALAGSGTRFGAQFLHLTHLGIPRLSGLFDGLVPRKAGLVAEGGFAGNRRLWGSGRPRNQPLCWRWPPWWCPASRRSST